MTIDILALNGVFDTGLAALLDAFRTANELAAMKGLPSLHFDLKVIGLRKKVLTAQGLSVPVVRADGGPRDLVIVPALGHKMPEPLLAALGSGENREAAAALGVWAGEGRELAAACIGTFVLAESGALDGQRATTTWWLAPLFRQRYPRVRLEETHMIVQSGRTVTAGAALGHLDLALWLIRRKSPELAALTARYLIVDTRSSQTAYALADHLVHTDPLVGRFELWARERLACGFSLDEAAAAVGTSKRTLARRLDSVLGKTPLAYFQDLRLERAVFLLQTTEASVDEIAALVGYAEAVSLRNLIRRRLGLGIRELRRAEPLGREP
jgi:transcriptional regulator GlxA family with amidase domain